MEHRKMKVVEFLKRGVGITVGALLMSLCLKMFFVPSDIIDGGVVGISLITSELFHLPLGVLLFVLNIPFVWLGYRQIGKTFAISTMFGITIMSVGTFLFSGVSPATTDPLLSAVFGGIGLGIGVGLVLRFGGSLDGTEIVAILINKKYSFSVGETVMFFNVFILGSAGFVFGWEHAMYSMIAYYIAFKVIDVTMEGFQDMKSVWIISEKEEEISSAITNRLGRTITYFKGEGGYSQEDKRIIFVVVTRLEEAKLKSIVDECDENAFMAIGNMSDVSGSEFKKKNIH